MAERKIIPHPSSLPTTVTKSVTLKNEETPAEISISIFSDRIQILISQRAGKVGTFLTCTHEFSQIDNSHTYHTETLLGGKRDGDLDLSTVYARQIMERIVSLGNETSHCPPLLLGITLNQNQKHGESNGMDGQKKFQLIVGEVVALYQSAVRIIASNQNA